MIRIQRQAIACHLEYRCTIKNYRKDGSAFWNDLHLCPVFDTNGNVCLIVGAQMEVDLPGFEEVTSP